MHTSQRRARARTLVAAATLAASAALAACGDGITDLPAILIGRWGGDGLSLLATSDSAVARFDCATGALRTPVLLSSRGTFSADGGYVQEVGPAALGNPARYSGRVEGDRLTLRVVVTDTLFDNGTVTLGPFEATRGRAPVVAFCW